MSTHSNARASKVSPDEVNGFFETMFPAAKRLARVAETGDGFARVRLETGDTHLRPGGLISGPTQMALADTAAYVVVFTRLGITPMAVTSSLNMSFLRPCTGEAVLAEGRLMKIGRTLAVIEVEVRGEGADAAASHAVVTYSLPQSGVSAMPG